MLKNPRLRRLIPFAVVAIAVVAGQRHRAATPPDAPNLNPTAIKSPAAAPRTLQRGSVRLTECDLSAPRTPFAPVAAYCASVSLPEDRAHPEGRHVSVRIALIPSTAEKRAPDAVTFLDGGPGGAALADFPLVAHAFAPLLKSRDILLIDQRGTGQSNAFECPTSTETDVTKRVSACAAHVSTYADPRFYTTLDATADLDEVRAKLGYPTLTLIGVSYGTRVAQIYARDYPRSVRAIVLDSPVPNTLTLGSEHALNLDTALQARFATCVADRRCRDRFGDPRQTLQALLAQLEAHPIDVTVEDPVTHVTRSEHLTRAGLAQLVRFYAYSPQTAALLPLTLDEARAGRYQALLGQLLLVQGDLSTRLDGPMELSVLCSEDASLLQARPEDAQTTLGSAFVQQAQTACAVWPHAPMPPGFHAPLTGSVPTLLLSGEFDPVTPPRYAHEIARHLTQASVLVLPGQGHSVMGIGCAPDVVERFVSHANSAKLEAECLQRERATPFFLGYAGAAP